MSRGIVITAKGERLSMDELIMKARRPLKQSNIDRKDTVQPQRVPAPQMQILGFVPSAEGVEPPVMPQQAPAVIAAADEHDGPSMADFTGIRLEQPRFLKEKPEDPIQTANETLNEIMDDLEQYAPNKRKPVKKS